MNVNHIKTSLIKPKLNIYATQLSLDKQERSAPNYVSSTKQIFQELQVREQYLVLYATSAPSGTLSPIYNPSVTALC